MNNTPDSDDKIMDYEPPPLSEDEFPVESCIMLSEIEQHKNEAPVKMHFESDTRYASATSLALLFGVILTCLYAGVILTFWKAFNPYGFVAISPVTFVVNIFFYGSAVYYLFFLYRCIKRRSGIQLKNYLRLILFTAVLLGIMGLTYVIVPPVKLLFIILSAGALTIGILLLKRIEQHVYDQMAIYMIIVFVIFLFFMSFKVYFAVTAYEGLDYSVQFYRLQYSVADDSKADDHVREEKLMGEDLDEFTPMYEYITYNNTIFESEHGVDTFFDRFEEENDYIYKDYPVTRQISAGMRDFLEPVLQQYDSEFFEDNNIIMLPRGFNGNLDNFRLPMIYSDLTTGDMVVNVKADRIDDSENPGVCFILIEIPKTKTNFGLISHVSPSITEES